MSAGQQPITAEGVSVSRDRSTFRQADLTKAFKAAKKAGVDVQVEIDLERKRMRITPVKPIENVVVNEWDEVCHDCAATAEVR
jgi:hypothetical protein